MSGSGKDGNNYKKHHRFPGRRDEIQKFEKKQNEAIFSEGRFEKTRASSQERLQWTAPILPVNPITTPECKWCGKQITDITTAISDKETGLPIHFDCVLSRIFEMEQLDSNDSICYIGGGRFGIIHYNNPPDVNNFTIKKVLEWEPKDFISEWRRPISEYFSIT